MGAFRYARSTSQRPVELTNGKWNSIVRKKQNFQLDRSVLYTLRPKFRLLLSAVGLEMSFENEMASFGRTGPTGQRGPPLVWRWTTFSEKYPPGLKHSIYVSTEISGNFGIMESTHCLMQKHLYTSSVKKEVVVNFLENI